MGLFDFIFQRKKTPVTTAAGTTGVASYAGRLATMEISPDLQGRNIFLTYSNMIANSTVVGAAIRYYQNLLGGTSWSVEPKEGAGSDGEKAADLVRTGLLEANMADPWSTCVKRASLFRMHGFSLHEWTMRKRPDGRLVYNSIEHRPQATVELWDIEDDSNVVRGVVQRPLISSKYYYVDRSRLWYCVDNSLTDSPDGIGALRHVVEHARRLSRYEQLEGFSYETDLRGIPVGRIPYQELVKAAKKLGKDDAWIQKQISAVENLVTNHVRTPWQGITMDSIPYQGDGTNPVVSAIPQWTLELLKGDGVGLVEIAQTIERLNREIARVLGMEFMLLGGDGKGSLALSRDKTSMFASVLEASLHELAWFASRDLVFPLLAMNGFDPELVAPKLLPDPIATERIETTVDALWKLGQAGAVLAPNDPAVDQIRARLHLAAAPKMAPELAAKPTTPGSPPDPKRGEVDIPVDDLGDKTPKKAFFGDARRSADASPILKTGWQIIAGHHVCVFANRGKTDVDLAFEGNAARDAFDRVLKIDGAGWNVYADDGTHLGGPYETKRLALARLVQAERFKE